MTFQSKSKMGRSFLQQPSIILLERQRPADIMLKLMESGAMNEFAALEALAK